MSISIANSYLPVAGLSASQHISASAFLTGAAQKTVQAPPSVSQGDAVVNISPAAQQITKTGLPGWVNERIEKLSANPDQDEAMHWVELITATPEMFGPLFAIHKGPPEYFTYTYTGELVTPENMSRYTELNRSRSAETARIFYTEKANGASAAEIFEKTQQYMATLPEDYLRQLNWFRSTWAQPDGAVPPRLSLEEKHLLWNQSLQQSQQAQPERPDMIQDLFKILDGKP
jgi:hypothetical protein